MTLKEFITALRAAIFPMRTHLEQEISYLKQQLAYQQRRGDELTAKLIALATPEAKQPRHAPAVPKIVAKGWDAYRMVNKETNDTGEEATQSDAPAAVTAS